MGDIAYQNKDITAKILAEALKEKSLAVLGLPGLRIADSLPTKLPDRSQSLQALAGILTFSDKVIDRDYREQI